MFMNWGHPIIVTLAHDPTRVCTISSADEALSLLRDPDWGDSHTAAFTAAERELYSLQIGTGSAARARQAFFTAADAAGNSAVEARNLARPPRAALAAE